MLMPGGVVTNNAFNCCERNLKEHLGIIHLHGPAATSLAVQSEGGPGIFTLQLQALAMLSQLTASRQGHPTLSVPAQRPFELWDRQPFEQARSRLGGHTLSRGQWHMTQY